MKENRVAVVSGAARGIGIAVSEKLLGLGFHVCMTDKDAAALEASLKHLGSRFDAACISSQILDVENTDTIQAAAKLIQKKWGAVHVLVNNAGVFSSAPALELKESEFERILSINLTGTFRASQIFGRIMTQQKEGKIINIASIAGLKGAPLAAHYAASKAGVLALTKTMAVELAPYNVQVNAVVPGYIETDMMGDQKEQLKKLSTWRTPVKRLGLPEEVAEIVGFLASSTSSFLTGAEIVIDGGMSLN